MCIRKVFPFRLITFDVTNTILKFTANIGKTYGDIGEKHGVKCDTNELTECFKLQFKKMCNERPNFGSNTCLSWEKWWRSVVFDTFRSCRSDIPDSRLEKISEELIEVYKTKSCWKPASGAVELLNYLNDRGVTLGVISNSDPRLHEILNNLRMYSYFKFVLTSYEVGYSKPDKRIFERAMTKSTLKNLCNEQCLHIGDNFEFDYVGARSLNWNSFLINRKNTSNSKNNSISDDNLFVDLKSLKKDFEDKWNNYHVPNN